MGPVRRSPALWLSLAALPWAAACAATESFVCDADVQCVTDVEAGRCEPEGVCSFPDAACPSGHRYGKLAGELSGECVGAGASDGSSEPGATSLVPEGTAETGDGSSGPAATSTTSTSTGTTTTTSMTSTTTEPETTGTGVPDPFGSCNSDVECAVDGSVCIPAMSGGSVCSPPCDVDPCTYEGMARATVCLRAKYPTAQTCMHSSNWACAIFCLFLLWGHCERMWRRWILSCQTSTLT